MHLAKDIACTLANVGVAFTTERLGTATADDIEYFTYTPNTQVTKPFVREHFLETVFKSTTNVQNGDIIITTIAGDSYLCVNNTPDVLENEIIRYLAVLYKTNVLVDVLRPQNTTVGYDTSLAFATVHSSQKALIYAPLFGNKGEINEDIGFIQDEKEEMYISAGYGIKANDRVVVHGTSEKYIVSTVITRRYPGVAVLVLDEDTRE